MKVPVGTFSHINVHELPITAEGVIGIGNGYNHFSGSPYLVEGYDEFKSGYGNRGDTLVIPCYSEDGTKWRLLVGFHKGTLSIGAEILP